MEQMDQAKLNIMQLHARALAMAIRGHFRAASEHDADVLEALASNCVSELDELSHAPATVRVVLVAYGDRKLQAIKEVRGFTGMGLKEAKELVEAALVALSERFDESHAIEFKHMLEGAGASVIVV
jgi:ribosomal protein L7/L12